MSQTPHLDLVEKAIRKSGPKIFPVRISQEIERTWFECYMEYSLPDNSELLTLSYNTEDKSSHMVREKIR